MDNGATRVEAETAAARAGNQNIQNFGRTCQTACAAHINIYLMR